MLRPLGDHLLVRPLKDDDITKSGIVIPDSAKEKPQSGTVIAIGTGNCFDVKEGDIVMFTKYGPTEVKIDDEDLYILTSGELLGVVQ